MLYSIPDIKFITMIYHKTYDLKFIKEVYFGIAFVLVTQDMLSEGGMTLVKEKVRSLKRTFN